MHRLQIFDSQTLQIPLRGLHGRMAEDFRQVEQVPALPQVENAERVLERVETFTSRRRAQPVCTGA